MCGEFPVTLWHIVNIFSDYGLSEHLPENDESEEMVSCVTTQKVFLSVLPSDIWFCLIQDMTETTIAEQERFLGLHFATYCISLCAFSRETVLLSEKEQSLPNNLLVTDKYYVEHHGRDINLHFICVTNQWIPTMEEGSEKIGVMG